MDLKEILSISGYPGLFKLIKHSKNAIIVESLETKKRMPAYATSKISSLEDIAMYTEEEEVHLSVILKSIFDKENGEKTSIKSKDKPEVLKKYMSEVLPDYDKDRVYVSDIKRLINWYNLFQRLDLLKFEEEKEAEKNDDAEANDDSETKTVKKKKTAVKKSVAKKKPVVERKVSAQKKITTKNKVVSSKKK